MKIAIVGASGHGKVIAELAELIGYEVSFFDDKYPDLKKLNTWCVEGDFNQLLELQSDFEYAFVAIGDNYIREKLSNILNDKNFKLPVLKHPCSCVSQYAELSSGTAVLAGAVINAYASVGSGCIINSNAVVEHDSTLSDYVHISPGAQLAGEVTVEKYSWVGLGASIRQCLSIGSNVVVGAGSVVVKNIPDNLVVTGIPAKELRKKEC